MAARRRRRIALGVLALAALLGHWQVLSGIGDGMRGAGAAPRDAAFEVRTIEAQALADALADNEPVPPADVPVSVAPQKPKPRLAAPREATSTRATPPDSAASAAAEEAALAATAAASAPDASASSVANRAQTVADAASTPRDDAASTVASSPAASAVAIASTAAASSVDVGASSGAASSVAIAGASAAGDLIVPTYRTQIPPPMTMTYEVRRGFLRVKGEARWRPADGAYRAELEAKLGGITALGWTSEGAFDSAGIAPVRFTDKRLNRINAANFQREAHKISFSGNPVELPIPAGAQDRFSYLFQLAAVLSAEPERVAPGGSVAMYVVGARADASVWVLRYVGFDFVDTVDGAVRAARFTRDARGPYDSTIDVWVDPARYYLPVRAKQRSGSDEIDILLETMTPG